MNHMSMNQEEIFEFGEFRVDPQSRSLLRNQAPIALSRRAFDVLLYLVRNPGKVVTKEELLKNVWPDSFVDENNLSQSISALRKALDERPGQNAYITTLAGRGYQFVVPVKNLGTPAVDLQPATVLVHERTRSTSVVTHENFTQQTLPAPPLHRHPVLWLATAAVLTVSIIAGTLWWRQAHRPGPPPLVVLSDFENATGDPQLDKVLDSALEIDIQQSPYLSFLSHTKIQETLGQMQRPKAAPFSPDVAREVCQRNNAQVLLHGVVAKFGQRFLLTLDAIDCQSGESLGETKREATTADDIPHSLDLVAAEMRRKLGESRASIRQYSTPLFPAATNSLEALQRYSEASQQAFQGKYGEAIGLFKRAIELDPHFAIAIADMSTCYGNLGDHDNQVAALKTAYNLRDQATESDRLYITEMYNETITGDIDAEVRNLKVWTTIYPNTAIPWANLGNAYTQLGQYELAIPPARQALTLAPGNATAYVILARALMRAGNLDEAKAICDQAIANKHDGGDLHSLLMEIDTARHDPGGVQAQVDWAATSSSPSRLKLNQALIAFATGKIHLGQQLIADTADYYTRQGMAGLGNRYLLASTRMLADEGNLEAAQKLLDTLPPIPGMTDPLVALAEVGESDKAAAILKQEMAQHPQDTLWLAYRGPQIQAAIELSKQKPLDAVNALTHATALDFRGYDVLYLRGQAFLQAHQPANAEKEFRKILDRPGLDPLSNEYNLAQLGLARALAAENNPDASAAYQSFLTLWKDADPDAPLLQAAHREYDQLPHAK